MSRDRRVVALSDVRLDTPTARYARALAEQHPASELLAMLAEKATQANQGGGGLNLAWHLEVHAMRCALEWRSQAESRSSGERVAA